ncbi:MAG: septum formation initiator family protein [Christensenellaceae bacterium]|jgi:cell division protein FtsB|nr:septum formation initiator family protein [Christensenellaceae bacterium]
MSNKRKILLFIGLCALLALCYFGAAALRQRDEIAQISAQNKALREELAALDLRRSALKSDLALSRSDEYIERIAREFGFIKEGEIKFIASDGSAVPEPSASPPPE